MIFKRLHKNKLINLGLFILAFLIIAYFYKTYYLDKRKEGLANKCPEGCVKDNELDGNCRNGVCPMICPNPDIGGEGCQYDTDCSACPTSKPQKNKNHKKHKPHGTHNIGGDPATWTPESIIDGKTTPDKSRNSMMDSKNTSGYGWEKVGSKIGKLIAGNYNNDDNADDSINSINKKDNSLSNIQDTWNEMIHKNN